MTEAFLFGGISSAKVSEPSSRQKNVFSVLLTWKISKFYQNVPEYPPALLGG
jgi:hypothetical protein